MDIGNNLYVKYLWPEWMFKDANKGTSLERAAAYRHNMSMANYLPTYIRRWTVLTGIAYTLVVLTEAILPKIVAGFFGVIVGWAVATIFVLIAMYLLLKRAGD